MTICLIGDHRVDPIAASAEISNLGPMAATEINRGAGFDRSPCEVNPVIELTVKEREVLALVAEGLSNRQIAHRLGVNLRTIETHVSRIFLKLGLYDDPSSHRRVLAVLAHLHTFGSVQRESLGNMRRTLEQLETALTQSASKEASP